MKDAFTYDDDAKRVSRLACVRTHEHGTARTAVPVAPGAPDPKKVAV